jgi:ketosteroid isomerase-like protein
MAVLTESTVADELAIRQLTAAYSDAVNRRDFEAFAALWEPDGRWVVPGLEDAVGGEAAAQQLRALVDTMEFMLQFLNGGQVWVEGGSGRARWYIEEIGRTKDGQGVHFAGVYQDEHVRAGTGWRFARRRFDFLYRGLVERPGKAYAFPALEQ